MDIKLYLTLISVTSFAQNIESIDQYENTQVYTLKNLNNLRKFLFFPYLLII